MLRTLAIFAFVAASADAFAFTPASALGSRAVNARATASPLALYMDAALIVQNKGGGHGEIGFHLAKQLRGKGLDVTLLQDSAAKMDKAPFSSYKELTDSGVEVMSLDLSDAGAVSGACAGKEFTHVFDNWAKDKSTVETVAGMAKGWGVKSYAYVSSGGMYEASAPQPMTEDGPTKATGQREVEEFLASEGLPWTAFRPQYIYGPKTNKRDYIDWFFHRVCRDRPCPIPGDGSQMASVSRAEDVAAMLAAVVGKEGAAAGQVFNCGTDTFYSYSDICKMVAKVVGKEAKIVMYDPKAVELPKGAFPFRNTPFYVTPEKAKKTLGWATTSTLEQDLGWYYDSYKAAGLEGKDMVFEADELARGAAK